MPRTGSVIAGGGPAVPPPCPPVARYQLRPEVSAPGLERFVMYRSVSTALRVHSRKSCQLFRINCSSAVPVWRKNAMYQDFSRCSIEVGPPGAPTDRAAYLEM